VSDLARPGLLRRLERRLRRGRDRVLHHLLIAALRRRSRHRAKIQPPIGPVGPVHGLFLHHVNNASIDRHFARLVAETDGLVVWHRLYNPGRGDAPETDVPYMHPALSMPRRFDAFMCNPGGIQGGYVDVAILPTLLATGGPFVWVMEYDVEFAGDWRDVFVAFADNRADFLATSVLSWLESRDWWYWGTAKAPAWLHRRWRFHSFNPLMRLSRRFALAYVAALRDGDWQGHYEFTLPTIAIAGGFTVEDIGGGGSFCLAERRNRFYSAQPASHTLSPGSFVFRPVILGYYPDSPELFATPGLLYHPCKVTVPAWDTVAPAAADVLNREAARDGDGR
jgi:hypothetical protein